MYSNFLFLPIFLIKSDQFLQYYCPVTTSHLNILCNLSTYFISSLGIVYGILTPIAKRELFTFCNCEDGMSSFNKLSWNTLWFRMHLCCWTGKCWKQDRAVPSLIPQLSSGVFQLAPFKIRESREGRALLRTPPCGMNEVTGLSPSSLCNPLALPHHGLHSPWLLAYPRTTS